ncbi:hypothetical protein N7492_007777 [Penicillium capsulatum]|uniref:Uncharacterized protein n=1 Tax=Penicillium capsulatum TaxID=69766 RepID=A0A9W9I5R8_9EURO|nr:hypothetical protein N7492_007777 [Penicillium capsulatum]KAJ6117609.1 hypothetical protein N7512_007334 [Penicillium capsulatum]
MQLFWTPITGLLAALPLYDRIQQWRAEKATEKRDGVVDKEIGTVKTDLAAALRRIEGQGARIERLGQRFIEYFRYP